MDVGSIDSGRRFHKQVESSEPRYDIKVVIIQTETCTQAMFHTANTYTEQHYFSLP